MSRRRAEQANATATARKETEKMNAPAKPPHRARLAGLLATLSAAALLAAALAAPSAQAAFGLNGFGVGFEEAGGSPAAQAGSHPDAVTTVFGVNYTGEGEEALPDGEVKDLAIEQVPGLVGDATALPRCSNVAFFSTEGGGCPAEAQVGEADLALQTPEGNQHVQVYNLLPPPGVPVRIGFKVLGLVPIVVDLAIKQAPPYDAVASLRNVKQTLKLFHSTLTLWGIPAEHGTGAPDKPFLTLPTACAGPQRSSYEATSWQGGSDSGSALTEEGFAGCGKLNFTPQIDAKPTSANAGAGSGLDFDIDFDQGGLTSPTGLAQSTIERAQITLPEGVTVDPSLAEGIGVCSPGELAGEAIGTPPGGGCPQGSKIGTVEVETPLLPGTTPGQVYLAAPGDNLAGDSLIAFYIVLKDPANGLLVKLPAKVSPDPDTGQLITTVEDIPQLPFSHFHFHFREGQRAPLITPPGCGTFTTEAELTPWARPGEPIVATSSFRIAAGPDGGPCLSGAPFRPGFEAGTESNQAGSYSPFLMRLTRNDGEQDLSRFSAVLPRGVLGRLAGVSRCPEAAIAAAKAKTGLGERAAPSCPPGSTIGSTIAAAGVGSALTYVPGSLYLAGPYHGDPLSVVAITPAVAGPFDVGTVVVREALTLNPETAEVQVDGSASDPIPHILEGIPLNLRELRVDAARNGFTLNATSCQPSATLATLWGAGTALAPSGETPVGLGARYQAAGCAALAFKPKLGIKLRGGTKRGAHPALRAVVTPKRGNANFSRAVVTLPSSAFLDQGHIRTVCTRVQFAAAGGNGAGCPRAAVYGHARAWTPLLDEPLQGPVYLRSSNHKLPDLVVALHGIVDLNLDARIDSVKLGKGGSGIRSTFAGIPDAPVSRFILDMQGGKKGLVQNSTDLCKGKHRARANLKGQNGKLRKTKPIVRAVKCKKGKKKSGKKR